MDPLTSITGSNYSDEGSMRPIFDEICRLLQKNPGTAHTLLIIDDLSTLEWIGFSVQEISRFARAICAVSAKVRLDFICFVALNSLKL